MKRYKVATSHGAAITGGAGGNRNANNVTASVLDTRHAHREVKRFRSEERGRTIVGPVHRRRETIRLAQEYADKLNAECDRT